MNRNYCEYEKIPAPLPQFSAIKSKLQLFSAMLQEGML